ncbi:lipid-A-disaccharide synthase [Aquabacterium lacunae]|uniref:Lipid-A-disaccharide synthase n=2 Tax=Aquabacterium lacunae TaxID=2528630 RepID=A0A4Q9H121_9BURK|nr:lipid-A-disaccharide synthase [Aquabacterium lacunae]
MVAGEASGDLLAGLLLGGLKQRFPGMSAFGIGGPKMAAQGFDAWWPHHKLSVFGFVDALRHYRELSGIRDQLGDRLLAERPDVFVGVDAPDFNFGLERRLKEGGIRTVHFVSPSIWAWRGGRIDKIARSTDHVLCLFPFEPELYQAKGIAATFVGHPLADTIPMEAPKAPARAALGLTADAPVLAVLPGSRRSEIQHIAPAFLQTVAVLARQRPDMQFVMPVVPGLRDMVEPMVREHCPDAPLQVLDGRSHEALAACDVTLIASGTATLEAALFKRPMVIAYRLGWMSWQLMRHMGYLPWVGLPNILARDFVVPERLQDAASPQQLAQDCLAWFDQPARMEAVQGRFAEMHNTLRRDTGRCASDAIAKVLESR